MQTFVIKQIHWPVPISGGLQRSPNSSQSPEKKIVYSLNGGVPKQEWRVMDDGTLSKIHGTRMNAWVHRENDKWFWTPVNSVMGSYRVWDAFEIDVEYDDGTSSSPQH
jgi:hypothetical protein